MEHDTIRKILTVTTGGWLVSVQDIETALRCGSLVVTTTISIILFIKNIRGKRK
jgi:glycerol-3-phosphate responsive antiterminator